MLTLNTFLIALVGGIAGGLSKHVFEALATKAKERIKSREVLESIVVDSIERIQTLARMYWAKAESPETSLLAGQIVALFDQLPDLYIQLLDKNLTVTRQLDTLLNRLDVVVTGGTFQQTDRVADYDKIAAMERLSLSLIVRIRLEKAKLPYPWR